MAVSGLRIPAHSAWAALASATCLSIGPGWPPRLLPPLAAELGESGTVHLHAAKHDDQPSLAAVPADAMYPLVMRVAPILVAAWCGGLVCCAAPPQPADPDRSTSPARSTRPTGPAATTGPAVHVQDRGEVVLTQVGVLGPGVGKENSGLVRSRRDPSVFWALNDSGDEPRVYAVRADGSGVPTVRSPETPGTLIGGAINGDWEAIAIDASGRLIIADVGNNTNARADLCLYFVEEPEPDEGRTTYTRKVLVRYPEQSRRPAPPEDFNYDAEGVFTVGDEVYILTKNRSDTFTALYRLAQREIGVVNPLQRLGRFDVRGPVTAADASDDGLRLAVLTYDRVWLFERRRSDEPFFGGRVSTLRYRLPSGESDCESIAFDGPDSLLIADEATGRLFRLAVSAVAGR